MRDFNRNFRVMQRVVWGFIALVFILIMCYFIAVGVLAYKAVTLAGDADWSGGVKPVVERIWCGKPGCLDK